MSGEEKRADPFAGEDLDLSGFNPVARRPIAPRDQIRVVSEASGFPSRAPENAKPQQRRRRTGRNLQLNLKVTAGDERRASRRSPTSAIFLSASCSSSCSMRPGRKAPSTVIQRRVSSD